MNEASLVILLFKIAVCFATGTTLLFIAEYTKFAPWWKEPVGQTIVWKDIALLQAFGITIVSLFFGLSKQTSYIAGFVDAAIIFEIGCVMAWRCWVWYKIHRGKRKNGN